MRIGGGAEQENGGAAGGPRSESGAEDSAGGDGSAEEFGFKKFGNEIGDGHRAPTQKVEDAFFAEAADVTTGLEEIPEIFRGRRVDRWRSDRGDLAENFGDFGKGFGEFRVFGGVFCGETRDTAGGFGVVVVEEERATVGRRSEDARIGIKDLQILLVEAHVARDVGAKRTDGVRERRGAIARVKFFGDGTAADDFAAFKNDGFESALCEIESGDECVVTAADDDYALSDGHVQFFSLSGAMVESDGALATSSAVSGTSLKESVRAGSSCFAAGAGTGGAVATAGSGGAACWWGLAPLDAAGFERSPGDPPPDFFHSLRMTWLAMRPGGP